MNRNPDDVLLAMRPDPDRPGDDVRDRILATDRAVPEVRRPGRRRRFAVALAGALVLTGGGAAVAGGRVPAAFTEAFAGWTSGWSENDVVGADPATSERVGPEPGPDGTVFSVVAAPTRASDDPDGRVVGACTVAVLETPASARGGGPSQFQDVSGNGCQTSLRERGFGEAAGVDVAYADDSSLGVAQDLWVWSIASGDAVRVEAVTADGRTWAAVVHDGTAYGWVPAPAAGDPRPEVVGYAADGTEVGRAGL